MTLPPTASLDDYNRVLLADPGELDVTLPPGALTGELPDALKGGTWWGNGPSKLRDGDRLVHPFDGHGYVRALRFGRDGALRLRARYVKTRVFEAERALGRLVEVGLGTLPSPSRWTNLRAPKGRNVANTCVLPWAGSVLALWEGGRPHRLDPETLETVGVEDFHGSLAAGDPFCAHTRVDPRTGRLVGLSARILGRAMEYTVRELDATGHERSRRTERGEGFNVAHDFAITENWVVIVEASVEIDLLKVLAAQLGQLPVLSALSMSRRNARALLIPRGDGEARRVDLGRPLLAVHHANAWEEGERVVLVSCALPEFSFGTEFGWRGQGAPLDPSHDRSAPQELLRFDIEGARVSSRAIGDASIDFPTVRAERVGGPTRHVFGVVTRSKHSAAPLSGLARIELATGASSTWTSPRGLVGEPLLAPRGPDERDTWVLSMVYAPEAAELCIFDGAALADGPVGRVRIPVPLPYGFHGFWQSP